MGYTETEAIESKKLTRSVFKWIFWCGFLLLFVIVGGMIGCPSYNVYQQSKDGEAKLREAESSRQIAIQEAKAKMESSSLLSQADTIRAHGIARSNQIIGQSLTPAYLHWFWIDNIDKSQNVIYVPTEANLPIMEAGRFLLDKKTNPE